MASRRQQDMRIMIWIAMRRRQGREGPDSIIHRGLRPEAGGEF
jgi:hypothetical protein